jgi:protein-disulfide isomerase
MISILPLLIAMSSLSAEERLIEGNPKGAVRVIIVEDLQCPDCAAFREMLDTKLLPKYKDKVAFEHRDFPLAKHAWARPAAAAARYFESVSAELGVVWRRYIMANLKQTTAATVSSRIEKFAAEHRTDAAKAIDASTAKRWLDLVEADFQEGVARGISKTPTVFVNGEPFVETFTVEEISKAIDAALGSRP